MTIKTSNLENIAVSWLLYPARISLGKWFCFENADARSRLGRLICMCMLIYESLCSSTLGFTCLFVLKRNVFESISEGELKIFTRIRDLIQKERYSSYAVVGNDADLILMSIASRVPNISVFTLGTRINKQTFIPPTFFSNNDFFKIYRETFPGSDIMDFVLLSLLAGNDYIPSLAFTNLSRLYASYSKLFAQSQARLFVSVPPNVAKFSFSNREFVINWTTVAQLLS